MKVVCVADSIFEPYEDSERRGHMRLSTDDVRWLRSARLKYGPDVDRQEFGSAPPGRKVAVTFQDGATLLGSTLGDRGEGNGFFVHPADPRSNNLHVFVAPGATQQVRFL